MSKYHYTKSCGTERLAPCVDGIEVPVISEIDNHCSTCDKIYKHRVSYRSHLHRIHITTVTKQMRDRDIIPDMDDKNNHCASYNRTYSNRSNYKHHLAKVHNMKKLEIKQEDTKKTLNILSLQTN